MANSTFEIRQLVKTVRKSWLETISTPGGERLARLEYEKLVAEHPTQYFELVKVTREEQCLDFTAQRD